MVSECLLMEQLKETSKNIPLTLHKPPIQLRPLPLLTFLLQWDSLLDLPQILELWGNDKCEIAYGSSQRMYASKSVMNNALCIYKGNYNSLGTSPLSFGIGMTNFSQVVEANKYSTLFEGSNLRVSVISLCGVLLLTLWISRQRKPLVHSKVRSSLLYEAPTNAGVTPVDPDFIWDEVEALKSFPFKNGEYKLTMGIKNLDPNDWLLIEPTYKLRIEAKQKIIRNQHPDYNGREDIRESTIFRTPESELYDHTIKFFCKRYPQYFEVIGDEVENKIMNLRVPRVASTSGDTVPYLEYLVDTMEEDFIILLKDPKRFNEPHGDEYHFKGGVFAFAAGFNPRDRFNAPLSFIHEEIPGYQEKLLLSMNRFFNRLAPGKIVTRSNFSMQTHHKLFADKENKGHNLPAGKVQEAIPFDKCDFNSQIHYRSERQTLTKLPKTGAMVFTIRTYMLPLSAIKAEGPEVCERLIGQIKGLPADIAEYKRANEWGPAVIQYLST